MKVTAWFKDGGFYSVDVPKECEEHGPAFAIEKAKEQIGPLALEEMERTGIKQWEVEEDFV